MRVVLSLLDLCHPLVNFGFRFLSTKAVLRCPLFDVAVKINLFRLPFQPHLLFGPFGGIRNEFFNPVIGPEFLRPNRQKPKLNDLFVKLSRNHHFAIQGILNTPPLLLNVEDNLVALGEGVCEKEAK